MNKSHTDLIFAIQEDIRLCVLSFKMIAAKHGVSIYTVNMVWDEMCEQENA